MSGRPTTLPGCLLAVHELPQHDEDVPVQLWPTGLWRPHCHDVTNEHERTSSKEDRGAVIQLTGFSLPCCHYRCCLRAAAEQVRVRVRARVGRVRSGCPLGPPAGWGVRRAGRRHRHGHLQATLGPVPVPATAFSTEPFMMTRTPGLSLFTVLKHIYNQSRHWRGERCIEQRTKQRWCERGRYKCVAQCLTTTTSHTNSSQKSLTLTTRQAPCNPWAPGPRRPNHRQRHCLVFRGCDRHVLPCSVLHPGAVVDRHLRAGRQAGKHARIGGSNAIASEADWDVLREVLASRPCPPTCSQQAQWAKC